MSKTPPRKIPSKDERYMGLAFWVASFSKDPDTQVGCVIVSKDNVPLGYGFNGPPSAFDDDELDWSRTKKYPFMRHAEPNAITHSKGDLTGSIFYVTAKPCKFCMLDIVSVKPEKVIYFPLVGSEGSSLQSESHLIADDIAEKGKIELVKFNGNLNWMRDRMQKMQALGAFD